MEDPTPGDEVVPAHQLRAVPLCKHGDVPGPHLHASAEGESKTVRIGTARGALYPARAL